VNLLKSPVRRTTAILAGAVLGMAGAVAFAAPASAHHPIVNAGSKCQNADGSWQVEWRVRNSEADLEGEIAAVETVPNIAIPGIAVGVKLPKRNDGVVTGIQQLPADVESSTLKVKGHWVRNGQSIEQWQSDTVSKPKKRCEPTPPSNPPSTPPSTPPSSAPPSNPPTSTPPAEEPGAPTPIVEADCDSITLGMDNPDDGVEIKLEFTTSKGEKRALTIAPGEKKTEKFSATPGFKITIKITVGEESATETVTYEKPEDCDSSGGGAGEPELPLTGAAAGGIAGGAALLLGVGGALFLMARRRKVKFTA
jgi:hypothetical protein